MPIAKEKQALMPFCVQALTPTPSNLTHDWRLLLEKELEKVTAPKVTRYIKELLHEQYPLVTDQSTTPCEDHSIQEKSIEVWVL